MNINLVFDFYILIPLYEIINWELGIINVYA